MKGNLMFYLDQYGYKYWARTIKELKKEVSPYGNPPASRMYEDYNSKQYHVGYVIGKHWCTAYKPVRIPQ